MPRATVLRLFGTQGKIALEPELPLLSTLHDDIWVLMRFHLRPQSTAPPAQPGLRELALDVARLGLLGASANALPGKEQGRLTLRRWLSAMAHLRSP